MSVSELQGVRPGREALPAQTGNLQKLLEALGGPMVLVTELGVASGVPKSRSCSPPATFLSIKFALWKAACVLFTARLAVMEPFL